MTFFSKNLTLLLALAGISPITLSGGGIINAFSNLGTFLTHPGTSSLTISLLFFNSSFISTLVIIPGDPLGKQRSINRLNACTK